MSMGPLRRKPKFTHGGQHAVSDYPPSVTELLPPPPAPRRIEIIHLEPRPQRYP